MKQHVAQAKLSLYVLVTIEHLESENHRYTQHFSHKTTVAQLYFNSENQRFDTSIIVLAKG